MDEDNPETPSIDAEEAAIDESQPATVICPYCYEENDALKLVSSQLNRCWKCGYNFSGFNRFGGPRHTPTDARFMWMARLKVVTLFVFFTLGLLYMICKIVK